jgi:hypothetical protein
MPDPGEEPLFDSLSRTDAIGRPVCACSHRPITHVDNRRECLVSKCRCQEYTVRDA